MSRRTAAVAVAVAAALVGCGGGAPLLHGAHVLRPGFVEVGAGLSGDVGIKPIAIQGEAGPLQEIAVAPGVAPWVAGRVGIAGENEAGLTFTGRSLRVDVRHAFTLNRAMAISTGIGASGLIAHQPGHALDATSVYGGGFDVPVLFGMRSAGGLYNLWIGPRGGLELLRGSLGTSNIGQPDEVIVPAKAGHAFAGGVVGIRTGFRHVHVGFEGQFTFHYASGTIGGQELRLSQFSIAPAGALLVEF